MSAVNQAFSTGGGLATEATLLDVNATLATLATEATLQGVDAHLTTLATEATLQGANAHLAAIESATIAIAGNSTIGGRGDSTAGTDTDTASMMSFIKRIAQHLSSIITLTGQTTTFIGALTETAPSTDTASSGLNGRLQRIAQRITSLIALFPATLGQKTMANSFAVTLASDQAAVPTSSAINSGSSSNTASATTTATTITAPANAVGFILQGSSANSAALRYRGGAVASSSIGMRLEPGQDSGYIPCGANISIASESGTQEYNFFWVVK